MIDLPADERCPKCHKPIKQATIELSGTQRNVALHTFRCEDCGPVITRHIDLTRRLPTPKEK